MTLPHYKRQNCFIKNKIGKIAVFWLEKFHLHRRLMPLLKNSTYQPPTLLRNGHLNTIYAGAFRRVRGVRYKRERIPTPDGDFIDLDWSVRGSDRLLIVLHGLEGHSNRPYSLGMIRYFKQQGWDGMGMNFRGCSGEPNRLLRSYHVGETGDLHTVLQHVRELDRYRQVALIGFSLGGNIVLKYIGEQGTAIDPLVKKAVALSVPCHVPGANAVFKQWHNRLYMYNFMRSLNAKLQYKAAQFPSKIELPKRLPRNFDEFDEIFTAPVHGFANAHDYWTRGSSIQWLPSIAIPTLLINAADDSFLSQECFPTEIADAHRYFHLEIPNWGGHCGFVTFNQNGVYWSEERAYQFVAS